MPGKEEQHKGLKMHAPARVQQLIAPRTACGKLMLTCTQRLTALKPCICKTGDPCDYHAATCVTCIGGCSGHPVNPDTQPR